MMEVTQLTLSLGRRDGAPGGRVRPPRACTKNKRKAAHTLTFTNPDEGQSKKKTKVVKKQTPAPVLKQTIDKKVQAHNQKQTKSHRPNKL